MLDAKTFPELDENTVTKLNMQKIFTVYDFMTNTCEDLMKKTGKSFEVCLLNLLRGFIFIGKVI